MKLASLSEFRDLVFSEGSRPDQRTLRKWFDEGLLDGARLIGESRFIDLEAFTLRTGDPLVDQVLEHMGRPRKAKNDDLEPNLYRNGPYFQYRNPITRKFTGMGRDKARANAAARKLNRMIDREADLIAKVLGTGDKKLAQVIDEFLAEYLPGQGLSDSTRRNYESYYRRYASAWGDTLIRAIDRQTLGAWLAALPSADAYNKHRTRLVELWRFAIARGYCDDNEPERTLVRNQSKRIEANRRKRQRLTLEQFAAIHAAAPEWFKIAMELALITLQGRTEIANARFDDVRDGWLYFIRAKTDEISDMAFIRIAITPQIEALIARARRSGIASPMIVHYRPMRRIRAQMDAKAHWSAVTPPYLSRTFQDLRDACPLFAGMEPAERPTFHEIRSLGARLYQEAGYGMDYIQPLMTHSDKKTTQLYLEGGRQALTDANFIPVRADLPIDALLHTSS